LEHFDKVIDTQISYESIIVQIQLQQRCCWMRESIRQQLDTAVAYLIVIQMQIGQRSFVRHKIG
jgi:hypothetical protein